MKLETYSQKDFREASTVLMRVDTNINIVPRGWGAHVTQMLPFFVPKYHRIEVVLPEIRELLESGLSVVILGHKGRPGGRNLKSQSLKSFSSYLARRLGKPVTFLGSLERANTVLSSDRQRAGSEGQGKLYVLENLRYHKGEEENSAVFAKQLAALGDVYINNAFSVCHRKHASVHAITKHMNSFAGKALAAEIRALTAKRVQPLTVVLGGIKFRTKLPLLLSMQEEVDFLIVGSGLAATFLKAKGHTIKLPGGARISKEDIAAAKQILQVYGQRVILPESIMVERKGLVGPVPYERVHGMVYDIGGNSFEQFRKVFELTGTVIWNGPLGYVESRHGKAGTIGMLRLISKYPKINTIIGGGDTLSFLESRGVQLNQFGFVSTGGGAMLAFLAGEKMPGLEVLV